MGNAPRLRFEGFTGDWEERKFANVFDGLQNNTLSRADLNYESGDFKNIHYGDVLIKFGDYIDASEVELPYISDSSRAEKFRGSFLKDGDIVVADTAEDDTVGKCIEIQGSEGLQLLSGLHTIACRPKEKYGTKFLGYYINSPAYHNQLKPLMQGIKVTSISKSALQDTNMIISKSVEEQVRIGEIFSNLDTLITLHQRKHDALLKTKKFFLQNLFPQKGERVPKIRIEGFTGDWEQRKLGELYIERNERGNDSLQILSVSIHSGVSDGELDEENLGKFVRRSEDKTKYKHVYTGDLIFNMMRAWQGALGVAKSEGMISPAYISAIPNEEVYPLFMDYAMRRQETIEEINNLSYGITDFRKRLYWDSFVRVTCKLPSVNEQKRIYDFFKFLDTLLTLHRRKCDTLKTIKQFMLQNMFA